MREGDSDLRLVPLEGPPRELHRDCQGADLFFRLYMWGNETYSFVSPKRSASKNNLLSKKKDVFDILAKLMVYTDKIS